MMASATSSIAPCSESGSRPGLTSLIKTGRGLMTVQTEILGEPGRLVTILDLCGRVLKRWQSTFVLDAHDLDAARRWHQGIEAEIRASLARLAKRGGGDRPSSVAACLFIEAMRAYAAGEYERSRSILKVCARLVPHDARVDAALARLRRLEVGRPPL